MGVNYSFELFSIDHWVLQFIGDIKFTLAVWKLRYINIFILPWRIVCNSSNKQCYDRNFGSLVYKCSDNFLSFETEDEVLCCKIDKFQFFHLPTSQFICWLAYLVLTNGSKMSWNWIWFFMIPTLIVFILHLPL